MNKYRLTAFVIFMLLLNAIARAQAVKQVTVKGGVLQMGEMEILVGTFKISRYEITNLQYASFLNAAKIGADGIYHVQQLINVISKDLQVEYLETKWLPKKGKENNPMVMVSYFGAVECAGWMGGKLPTEAEWLYAASGGRKSRRYRYAGSNDLQEVGWFRGNSDSSSHAIGQKKPNELGIYDMSGNAWEWSLNDTLKSETDFCVHMGGSWYAGEQPSRLTANYGNMPTHFSNSVGFRVKFANNKK